MNLRTWFRAARAEIRAAHLAHCVTFALTEVRRLRNAADASTEQLSDALAALDDALAAHTTFHTAQPNPAEAAVFTVAEQIKIIETRDAMRAMACERLQDEFAAHRALLFSSTFAVQLRLFAELVHAVRADGAAGNLTDGHVRYTARALPALALTLETNVPQAEVVKAARAQGWVATLVPGDLLMLNRSTPQGLVRVVVAELPAVDEVPAANDVPAAA